MTDFQRQFEKQPVTWTHGRRYSRRHRRRGAALYVAVMFTALIVSLLALSGLTLVRVERERASISTSRLVTSSNARSAVHLALRVIANDSDWRNTYINGQETTPQLLGADEDGTLSWILEDSDGSLTDADTQVRLKGVGRIGTTVQVNSIEIANKVGPLELRSQTSTASQLIESVIADKWWCQYLKVLLPAEAIGWKVTSVELFCEKWDPSGTLRVRLYEPLPSNMPSGTVIDSVTTTGHPFAFDLQWQAVDFSGDYMLDPADGVCLALEGTHSWKTAIQFAYESGGIVEPDSALITGDPTWNSYDTDKALMYRVHGVYWNPDGDMRPIMGSWLREAAPSP